MSHYPNLTWRQTEPGVWQRGIDEVEEFYSTMIVLYEGSGRMFFGMTGFLSLSISAPCDKPLAQSEQEVDAALEKSWLRLRYDHPTLASQVTQNNENQEWIKTYRELQNDEDRAAWLSQTLVHISDGKTGLQWANSDPPAPKIPTLFIVHSPQEANDSMLIRRDLVFRSPHDIIDGIGTLIMFNNLLSHASAAYTEGASFKLPEFDGSEAANLSPPYRVAANIPIQLTPGQKEQIATILAQKAKVASGTEVEVLALPYTHGALKPNFHQRVALTFSKEETAQLLAACKSIKATPTHVFHAAAAMADRDIQARPEKTKSVRYINYILRNERGSCAPPYNSVKHPAAVYHSVSGQSLAVDMKLAAIGDEPTQQARSDEFSSNVRTMREFYHSVRNDKEHTTLAPDLWALGTPRLPPAPRPLPVPPPNAHPSVSISSMGCVDDIIQSSSGAFRAHDAWVTGEELGNGLGLFLGTFNSELCLSAAYNNAWHNEAEVLDYLRHCKEIVFTELGLSS